MKHLKLYITLILVITSISCTQFKTRVDNTPQEADTKYTSVQKNKMEGGVGIESKDIVSMTDKMARDILSNAQISNREYAPKIIINSEYFDNESSSIINKKLITERLKVHLNRAANGRITFVERRAADMVEKERKLKRADEVSEGSLGQTKETMGADFRLAGKILSLDKVSNKSGSKSRYHQISFKLVDLETAELVWSNMYEFKKKSQRDIIYQ